MIVFNTIYSTQPPNHQFNQQQLTMNSDESFYYEDSYFDPLSLESLLNPKPPDIFRLFNSSSRYQEEQEGNRYQRDNESDNYPSATVSQIQTSPHKNRRSSNTIFKTSLSQFRKTVLDVISKHRLLPFIQQEIDSSYQHKNQSSFPKIVAIVRELSIDSKLQEKWAVRSNNLIRKKQQLYKKEKFNQKRLKQLIKSIECMTQAIKQHDFMTSFDIYWGKYRQSQKYEKCKQEVSQFQERFSIAYAKKVEELEDEKRHQNRREIKGVEKKTCRKKSVKLGRGSVDLKS